MGGDRRRATHSIDMSLSLTPQHNPRKRPPSDAHDCDGDQEGGMNECNAALILMKLQHSTNVSHDKLLGSSPGSSSSAASWSSGSASPTLSEDGHAPHVHGILSPHDAASVNARIRTTSVSTSDEGIVIDFKEERKKKTKKFRCTWKGCNTVELTQPKIERHIRNNHLGKKARHSGDYDSCSDNEHEEEFYYTEDDDDDETPKKPSPASPPTLSHRDMARPPHEDPEYQRQIVSTYRQGHNMSFCQPQQQQQQLLHHSGSNNSRSIHNSGNNNNGHITTNQHQQLQNNNTSCIATTSHHNYTWQSTAAVPLTATPTPTGQHQQPQPQQQQPHHSPVPLKHARTPSRPSHSTGPYPPQPYVQHQHHNYSSSSSSGGSSSSSNNSSPVTHSNNSANNMLQQLSQQNVTVTAHHTGGVGGQPHQQQHHLSSVTITPNYHPPQQQHVRGQQQTTASNLVANSGQHMPLQHVAVQHAVGAAKHTPNSPNRRTRGENKKCRKVYGMERREQWCTQCRWKKACSRFGD